MAVEKEIEGLKARLADQERLVKSQNAQPTATPRQPSPQAAPSKPAEKSAEKPAESGFVR